MLNYDGMNSVLHSVADVLQASACQIRFDMVILQRRSPEGLVDAGTAFGQDDEWDQDVFPPEPSKLDAGALLDIRECFDCRNRLDPEKHEGILRAMGLFTRISKQRFNEFLVLAYFSVIEMLITHQPGDREVGDSIRHQLLTKIPLLSARMPIPIAYGEFGSLQSRKVWDLLYTYRSAVAHGNHVDFVGSLKTFGHSQKAIDFLKEATRRILRQAMREPDLVTNLKAV